MAGVLGIAERYLGVQLVETLEDVVAVCSLDSAGYVSVLNMDIRKNRIVKGNETSSESAANQASITPSSARKIMKARLTCNPQRSQISGRKQRHTSSRERVDNAAENHVISH
jgi:hypothetical protein